MIALVSLYEKEGPLPLVKKIYELGIPILATSGTAKALAKQGIQCEETEGITGFSELLGGKIKTIHPKVHEAIARGEIGIVVVSLMPVGDPDADGLSMMDLGGVLLLRSAIKNHDKVYAIEGNTALSDDIVSALGGIGDEKAVRARCALEAMEAVVAYEQKTLKRLRQI